LVQILKDERGQKGAALTTFISLAGKYSVLMPNTPKGGGISRKIINSDDRKKIRKILQEIDIPSTMGLIVRTAGLNKTKNELRKDVQNIIKTWEEIKKKTVMSIAPSLVYEEGDLIKRAIRDIYDRNTNNIIVDGNEGYQKAKKQRRLVHIPMGRFGEAKEMAQAALFLASDESSYTTGTEFVVDGGITSAYVTPE